MFVVINVRQWTSKYSGNGFAMSVQVVGRRPVLLERAGACASAFMQVCGSACVEVSGNVCSNLMNYFLLCAGRILDVGGRFGMRRE